MGRFKVGDRVRCIRWRDYMQNRCKGYIVGEIGTIVDGEGDWSQVPVRFDNNIHGNSLIGRCKKGYGQFIYPEDLELAFTPDNQPTFDFYGWAVKNLDLPDDTKIIFDGNETIVYSKDIRGVAKRMDCDKDIPAYGVMLATIRFKDALDKEIKEGDRVYYPAHMSRTAWIAGAAFDKKSFFLCILKKLGVLHKSKEEAEKFLTKDVKTLKAYVRSERLKNGRCSKSSL